MGEKPPYWWRTGLSLRVKPFGRTLAHAGVSNATGASRTTELKRNLPSDRQPLIVMASAAAGASASANIPRASRPVM